MDKRTFIERAPIYYALGIASYFRKSGEEFASEATIQSYYYVEYDENDPTSGNSRLANDILLARGALYLRGEGFLEISLDDFGPPIFHAIDGLDAAWNRLTDIRSIPFFKYRQLPEKSATSWLYQALHGVNEEYARLGIIESDFDVPDNEWEPIPLDRDDEGLAKAQRALAETIEGVRADNGYAASFPEERDFVASELAEAANKLQADATVTRGFIKRKIMYPLGQLTLRFGKGAVGILAEAAKQAILDWLRKRGITFLDHFL